MCQIHLVTSESFNDNKEAWLTHLDQGAAINSHGSAVLFVDENTGQHSLLRSLDWEDIANMMVVKDNWTHAIIHQRFGTRGGRGLENTHFWQADDVFYCHNGVFRGKEQSELKVDSLIIGQMIESRGIWGALDYLQSQQYANVFMVDTIEGVLYLSRSKTNTLYTDGGMLFSTKKLTGICDKAVPQNIIIRRELDLSPIIPTAYNTLEHILNKADDDYEKAVKLSIHGDK